MNATQRKLVIAPFGTDIAGDDVLLFEHGLLFGLEFTLEAASERHEAVFSFADIHDQLGGGDKRDRATDPLTESDLRTLAGRASCDAFIDGMLVCRRNENTGLLAEVAVCQRIYHSATGRFEIPDALLFDGFTVPARDPRQTASSIQASIPLSVDYEGYLHLQYRICEDVFTALGARMPDDFTTDSLKITAGAEAYWLFIKGKRSATTPETKLGYYEQAIKKDGNFFLALYNAAMLYKTQTDYNTARTRLMRAASVTTDVRLLGDVYFELGLTSIYLGDTKTARNFWEKAVEFGLDNPTLLVNMAGTFEQEENWNEAKRLNQLALDRFPDYHKAMVNLARLHAMLGRLDLSIPLYERALELQPQDPLRHAVLGGCYLAYGRAADARAQFEQTVKLDPDGEPAHYARQELDKLGLAIGDIQAVEDDEDIRKRKRWGLW